MRLELAKDLSKGLAGPDDGRQRAIERAVQEELPVLGIRQIDSGGTMKTLKFGANCGTPLLLRSAARLLSVLRELRVWIRRSPVIGRARASLSCVGS